MHRKVLLTAAKACVLAIPLIVTAGHSAAQTRPLSQREAPVAVDSGHVQNTLKRRAVIYTEQVKIDGAPWVRLKFAEATLGEAPFGGEPTILRITSRLDGAVQYMNQTHLRQWNYTSAYFNGDTVTVEIIADPGAAPSRIAISEAWIGMPDENDLEDIDRSICDGVDDRVLSDEPANGRLLSVGCTAWIITDASNCLLTAGHCTTNASSVVQFNVPLSNSNGSLNHPGPEDQYAVDLSSVQTSGSGGVGNDWKYFGCFPNSNTGLTPYQAQQAAYTLAPSAPPVNGQDIRITGYGTTSSPVSPTWNQVQKTHTGPYTDQTGNTVRYRTDTTGGNSGSPVFDLSTGLAIGIHTHAGCNSSGGANQGTAIHHPNLQAALADPQGVCFPQGFTIAVSPASQEICAPADATYQIDIGKASSQNDPVTLSANNLPPGTTVSFSVNPVTPPGTSVMTISNTAAAPTGTSTIEVVGTTEKFLHSRNVTLRISNAIPPTVVLNSPANGAHNVPVLPVLSWNAANQATVYEVDVAADPGFTSIGYSAISSETSHVVSAALEPVSQYYWRVRALNACGDGAYSNAFTFTTMDVPPILLVDDDDNSPDVRSYYIEALTNVGVTFDVWDINNNTNPEPTAEDMAPYKIIIWFSGDGWGGTGNPKAGPKAATEAALAKWMESGGCFFLSSQDYFYDRLGSGNTTPNAFMQEYLGVAAPIAHDVGHNAVTGNNLFAAIGSLALNYPGSNFSDRVTPNAGGSLAFTGNQGGAGVTRDGGHYRATFLAFPFDAIDDAAARASIMSTILSWCGELDVSCPADIAPGGGDGQVNIEDLLAVIGAWGPCSNPNNCAADIAPDDGDGQVNVEDLLAVISAWGTCQ